MGEGSASDIQLRFSVMSAIAVLAAVFVLVLGQRWYVTIEEEAEDIGEQGRIIGANAAAALLFNDVAAGHEMLLALKNSSYVVEAALYRADGTRLADYRREGRSRLPDKLELKMAEPETRKQNLREMRFSIPIRVEGREAGAIVLRSSMDRVYRELGEFVEFFLMIMAVTVALAYFASYRLRRRMRQSRQDLVDSQYMIRQLSVHREQLVEQEHKRIAIEIHDDLGQILTTAMMSLKRLQRSLLDEHREAAVQVEEVEKLVEDALHSMKNIALDLRPAVLNFGLAAALEWLAERTLGGAGIAFHLTVPESSLKLDERCSTTLFRIAQESFTNIVRHANASNVWITLKLADQQLSLTIEDNGTGFSSKPLRKDPGFGLMGIRERAQSLQGNAEISSVPGQGVCVIVTVPLPAATGKPD